MFNSCVCVDTAYEHEYHDHDEQPLGHWMDMWHTHTIRNLQISCEFFHEKISARVLGDFAADFVTKL